MGHFLEIHSLRSKNYFTRWCCFVEDRKELRLTLVKVNRDASNCWKLLLENQYPVDPWTLNEMEKKLVLERFQNEVRFYCIIQFRTILVV